METQVIPMINDLFSRRKCHLITQTVVFLPHLSTSQILYKILQLLFPKWHTVILLHLTGLRRKRSFFVYKRMCTHWLNWSHTLSSLLKLASMRSILIGLLRHVDLRRLNLASATKPQNLENLSTDKLLLL